MAIKAILYDLGGVLAELRGESHLLPLVAGRLTREQMWAHWSTSPAVRAHETGRIPAERFAAEMVAELALPVSAEDFLSGFRDWIVGPFAEAEALVRDTARHYRNALLTNTSALHWPIIETLGMLPHMHHVIASYQIGRLKPDADFYEEALARVGVSPEEAVFFDDSAANVAAARALGIDAHRVYGAAEARQILRNAALLD